MSNQTIDPRNMKKEKYDIEEFKKDSVFKVPEKYFDDLPMKIQGRISESPKEEVSLLGRMQWAMVATAAVVIFSVGIVFFQSPNESIETDLLAQVSTEDIIDYLSEEDVSSFEIASVVDVGSLLDEESLYLNYLEQDLSVEDLEPIYSEYDYSLDVL